MDPVGAAVATVSRTMHAPGGQTLQLQYPRSMPEELVQRTVIPVIEGVVRTLASPTAAIIARSSLRIWRTNSGSHT